jgi:hypothetical protein
MNLKRILLALLGLIYSHSLIAGCDVRSASQLVNEREIGSVMDLEKTKLTGKCSVSFRLIVDGVSHQLQAEESGLEQEDSLCHYAIERAKKELLLSLGGKFQTQAITVCSDQGSPRSKVLVGDIVLETELAKVRNHKYFIYQNSKCRLFVERRELNRQLVVNYGVICQLDDLHESWIVVDKW